MAGTRKLTIEILGDAKGAGQAFGDAENGAGRFSRAMGGVAKAAVGGAIAIGGLAVAGFKMAEAAAEDEKAAAALAKTLSNVTGATDEQIAANEEWISAMGRTLGVADDQLRPAMDALVRGTGDVAKAQELAALAMDISAGTGKDLTTVSDALSKAFNGNLGPLKKLDPALADLVASGASADEVMKALSATFGGQAATAADTAAGKLQIAKVQFGEMQEEIGAKLIPVLAVLATLFVTHVIPAIEKVVEWVSSMVRTFQEGGLSAVFDRLGEAWSQAWPKIVEFLGRASAALWEWIKEATPVVLAQLGEWMAALGAWIVDTGLPLLGEKLATLADKLWEWIKDITPKVLEQLGEWMTALGEWLITTGVPKLWEKLAELGKQLVVWILEATPKAIAQLLIWMTDLAAWIISTGLPMLVEKLVLLGKELVEWIVESGPDTLVKMGEWMLDIAEWVVTDGIPKMLGAAKDMGKALIDGLVEGIGDFVGNLYTEIEKIVTKIGDKVKAAINTIIRGWNSLEFSLPKVSTPIGDFGGWTIGTPDIPLLAAGGAVMRSGSAVVGEAGAELVNLPRGATVTPLSTGGSDNVLTEVRDLLRALVDKDTDVYLDGRKVGAGVAGGSYGAMRAMGA